MPTQRTTLAYRPDPVERAILTALAKRQGLSLSRTIGQAIRRTGEQEGFSVAETERRLEEVEDTEEGHLSIPDYHRPTDADDLAAIGRGLEAMKRGDTIPGDVVFAQLREQLKKR